LDTFLLAEISSNIAMGNHNTKTWQWDKNTQLGTSVTPATHLLALLLTDTVMFPAAAAGNAFAPLGPLRRLPNAFFRG
jgi:hypothetical protein